MNKCINCWRLTEELVFLNIQNGTNIGTINSCRDLTEMCSQCIKFEDQRSSFFAHLCEVSAEVCNVCINKLEAINPKDGLSLQTIEAGKIFSEACREVAKQRTRKLVDKH